MSKIRILAIPSDKEGVGKYRILDPYKYLGEHMSDELHVDIMFDVPDTDESFKNYDIVVFHSFIHKGKSHDVNVKRIQWLKTNGIKVIMDTDDYWKLDQKHPMYAQITRSGQPQRRVELLKLVDYVTTTTNIYKDAILKYLGKREIAVFPNAIDETEVQFQPNPITSDKVRFGWLGGSSHLQDLELIKSGISSTYQLFKDKVQFVLCGFDTRGNMNLINPITNEVTQRPIKPEETVWKRYEDIFTNDYKMISDAEYINFLKTYSNEQYNGSDNVPYVRRWTLDITKYATNYNYFDVSLAPLADTEFNRYKSQLKVIESGFQKKAVIASEVGPYNIDLISAITYGGGYDDKGNSLLVSSRKNHKQWGQHMKRLVENPNLIEDLGNKLYETVHINYSLKKVSNDRLEFFKSIINK